MLQELLASYMQKYAYHDACCLDAGAFARRVTWETPDVVTTLNGWEYSRKEGIRFDETYRLNKEFKEACVQLCGDAGSMTMADREAREAELARAERERGAAALVENRTEDGVQITESGLQYIIVSPGSGTPPARSDSVLLHYRGETIDGNVFADTFAGEPVTLPLNAVIEGWAEGVTLIQPGGEIKLFIPPELGYGDQDVPGIEPGSTLVFETKLLSVE